MFCEAFIIALLLGVTTNATVLGAYAIGNAAGPFIWKKQYQPQYVFIYLLSFLLFFSAAIIEHHFSSNHVPWAILTACSIVSALLLLVLRFMYAAENKCRYMEEHDETYDNVIVTITDVKGAKMEKKVEKVCALPMSLYYSIY
jgi:hypothetical protein